MGVLRTYLLVYLESKLKGNARTQKHIKRKQEREKVDRMRARERERE